MTFQVSEAAHAATRSETGAEASSARSVPELHPLCTLFPRVMGAEFDALVADIKANGLRQPIVLHDGMILDGGNRARACEAAGVAPAFVTFGGGNLVSFVLSANLHRRHMTAGQQAAIVASATDWAKTQKRGRPEKGEGLHLETVAQRAAASGATTRTQKDADKLARERPEKAREVAQGKTSLYQAVKATKPPAKKAAAKTARQIAAERNADAANEGFDPVAELEAAQKQIERLTAEITAAEADDLKAEAMKWRKSYDAAVRGQSEAMDRVLREQKLHAFKHRQLMRCGKAIGVDDPDKIAPAVEAFVRQHRKAAA